MEKSMNSLAEIVLLLNNCFKYENANICINRYIDFL